MSVSSEDRAVEGYLPVRRHTSFCIPKQTRKSVCNTTCFHLRVFACAVPLEHRVCSQLVMFSECLKENQMLQLRGKFDKGMLRKCEKTERIDLVEKLVFFSY